MIFNFFILTVIKCTVNSFLTQGPFGKEAINCTVNKAFDVRSQGLCGEAPMPEENTTVLILGYDSSCERKCYSSYPKNSITINGTYIIAGTYVTRGDCNDTLWYADKKSIMVPVTLELENKLETLITNRRISKNCKK